MSLRPSRRETSTHILCVDNTPASCTDLEPRTLPSLQCDPAQLLTAQRREDSLLSVDR